MAGLFPQTRWSLVLRARGDSGRRALGELLQEYWKPLYLFARARGLPGSAAEDAVQGFVLQLLERESFAERLDPNRGRLRSYLKTAFRHFLESDSIRQGAQKRGGGQRVLELDARLAESCADFSCEDPEQVYEKEWAASVFEQALATLKSEHVEGKRSGPFEVIESYFSGEMSQSYRVVAESYGMSEPQLKSLLHRARKRYRELLLNKVRETIDLEQDSTLEAPEHELVQLKAALSS